MKKKKEFGWRYIFFKVYKLFKCGGVHYTLFPESKINILHFKKIIETQSGLESYSDGVEKKTFGKKRLSSVACVRLYKPFKRQKISKAKKKVQHFFSIKWTICTLMTCEESERNIYQGHLQCWCNQLMYHIYSVCLHSASTEQHQTSPHHTWTNIIDASKRCFHDREAFIFFTF